MKAERPPPPHYARSVAEIDWSAWRPTEEATLLFVIKGNHILLIHKKRGLGAGKINGPGGRVDAGESPRDAAVREVQEELRIRPLNVRPAGRLRFQFRDGYALLAHVFRADDHEGTPVETAEATPMWYPVDALPFPRMWADDPLWMPHLLAGRFFEGYFIFEGDRLLDHRVETEDFRPD